MKTIYLCLRLLFKAFASSDKIKDYGDKIVVPKSILQILLSRDIRLPTNFRVENKENNKITFCGIAGFNAPENTCYVPKWMRDALEIQNEGKQEKRKENYKD